MARFVEIPAPYGLQTQNQEYDMDRQDANRIFESQERHLAQIDAKLHRYLYSHINWNARLISIKGARGTGKTTLAKVIANTTSADFRQINATIAGKKDMEAVVEAAKQTLGAYGKKTILFISSQ